MDYFKHIWLILVLNTNVISKIKFIIQIKQIKKGLKKIIYFQRKKNNS